MRSHKGHYAFLGVLSSYVRARWVLAGTVVLEGCEVRFCFTQGVEDWQCGPGVDISYVLPEGHSK